MLKPNIEITQDAEISKVSIEARSEKELKDILKGLGNKYPGFDVEEALKSAKWQKEYLDEPLHFQNTIGCKDVFRAVCNAQSTSLSIKEVARQLSIIYSLI
ncbi:hypothetical protein [Rufibacter quisquiliarum]|uniref:Uncharacterized protein n=1 Tax=Rufibacter quisquiliarum TaxID=1549639 RepID=A0A839GJX2_9BACT|nr:hypothetical protein [Rufibacter quisquiliarum]MBA9077079.1 hypothetical protein [Rufibacter quisquiliarum]